MTAFGRLAKFIGFSPAIWVDTLAMVSAFSAQWAAHVGDARMLDFAAAQPGIYAATLQDPQEALFRHAYLVRFGRAVPRAPAFWLRGNGWALFGLAAALRAEHKEPEAKATEARFREAWKDADMNPTSSAL